MSPKAPYLSSISRMSVLVRFALHGGLPYCALSHNHHTDLVHYCMPCLQSRRLYDPNLIWALHKQLWLLSLQQRTTERPCDVWCYKRDHKSKRRSSKPFLIGGIFLIFPRSWVCRGAFRSIQRNSHHLKIGKKSKVASLTPTLSTFACSYAASGQILIKGTTSQQKGSKLGDMPVHLKRPHCFQAAIDTYTKHMSHKFRARSRGTQRLSISRHNSASDLRAGFRSSKFASD